VGAKELWIQTYAGRPGGDKPSVLPGRHGSAATTTTSEQEIVRFLRRGPNVCVECLAGLLGHLEPDWPSGLLLADCAAIEGMSVRRNVLYPDANEIAASELAVDRKIKHGEIA